MKFYKIIVDNTFIGAVHSGLFVVQGKTRMFYSDETRGQYVSYEGILYHDYWMQPVDGTKEFILAKIIEITENEYNTYMLAIKDNEPIKEEEEEEEILVPIQEEETPIEIAWLRLIKVEQMSKVCRKTIEEGFDMEIRGETKHFSLSTQDLLNLMSLAQMALTQSMLPYHADGEEVVFYAAEEILLLVDEMNAFKIYHTTYYNALKAYINSLSTIEELDAIKYGMEIPEEFKTDVLKALE